MFSDRVLYARKGEDVTSQAVTLGGDKITVEEAIVSRNFVNCPQPESKVPNPSKGHLKD